jgi:hypothetical protein
MKIDYTFVLIKTGVLIALLATLPLIYAIPACIILTSIYQYVFAAVLGYKVMPIVDFTCFLGTEKANANCVSVTVADAVKFEEEMIPHFRRLATLIPKMRYQVVEMFGDLYYKEVSIDEMMKHSVQKI